MTAKEWLETLPAPYSTWAIENTDSKDLESSKKSFENALESVFIWADTPQGHSFWLKIFEDYPGITVEPEHMGETLEKLVARQKQILIERNEIKPRAIEAFQKEMAGYPDYYISIGWHRRIMDEQLGIEIWPENDEVLKKITERFELLKEATYSDVPNMTFGEFKIK